jgi:hypothetical protein
LRLSPVAAGALAEPEVVLVWLALALVELAVWVTIPP